MILYNIMQQQVKLYKLTETRRQGDYILSFVKESIIRDAKEVQNLGGATACSVANSSYGSTLGDNFYMVHKSSIAGQPPERFRFFISGTRLVFEDINGVSNSLNSAQVIVERNGATGFIDCYKKSDEVLPLIRVTYRVTFVDTEIPEKKTSLYYSTRIRLRNR
jgi:hypothetical protein